MIEALDKEIIYKILITKGGGYFGTSTSSNNSCPFKASLNFKLKTSTYQI
jgi:hypothetical protein